MFGAANKPISSNYCASLPNLGGPLALLATREVAQPLDHSNFKTFNNQNPLSRVANNIKSSNWCTPLPTLQDPYNLLGNDMGGLTPRPLNFQKLSKKKPPFQNNQQAQIIQPMYIST